MAEALHSRLFTVPPGRPFLDCVATAILQGQLPKEGGKKPSAFDLPEILLLLPTRRAVRVVQDAFLRVGGGVAMLLPRIRPISEGDDDLALMSNLGSKANFDAGAGDIGPAIGEIERRLVLTELVLKWSRAMTLSGSSGATYAAAGARTPAQAAKLATDLARLIDMLETEGVDLSALDTLVPDQFAEHWQTTLDFLKIIVDWWPAHLTERGLLSPADRRNRLIRDEARRLATAPPRSPVIVAGVTGSIPATVELMRAVANLPHGAIVLPALDLDLDAAGWNAIAPDHPEHPQYGLRLLLERLGVAREDVRVLPGAGAPRALTVRAQLVSEAMRPASTTDRWVEFLGSRAPVELAPALDGISLVEAPTAMDEAEIVALILREAVETPGRTAVLVSPDRRLARRVAIRLAGMGIAVDDSAGRPFTKTPVGTLLDLILEVIDKDFAPTSVAALLKHPLVRLGRTAREKGFAVRALEIAALRTVYLGRGLTGLTTSLAKAEADVAEGVRRERAVRRMRPDDWTRARSLCQAVADAFQPMVVLRQPQANSTLQALVEVHIAVAEALARPVEGEAEGQLWSGEAGAAASLFFTSLLDPDLPAPNLSLRDYPDFFRGLVAGETVRGQGSVHPRVSIWGPFEARLQRPDVVVLGSLNDGTWPESADPGPWLNRPMRQALKLPAPEEAIGYAAHDFTALLGADRVHLTRALKIDGVPTVASRWLLRIRALLAGAGLEQQLAPDRSWLAWARQRDRVTARCQISAPEPRPPVALRPRRLSVSDIESWISNPYAIFARHILELEDIPLLGAAPDAALRGSIIHAALARFAVQFPKELPPDPSARLLEFASEILRTYTGDPRVAAFWVPRLERFARWFEETEGDRRKGVTQVHAEISGQMHLEGLAGPFLLRTRADRIDEHATGLIITDYKTGVAPSEKKVVSGQSPQLPLEAAIALAGGLGSMPAQPVAGLRYIRATGGDPPGESRDMATSGIAEVAETSRRGLERLIRAFDDPATPYRAVRRGQFRYDFDAYAHLARVAEWSGVEGDDDGADEVAT